jgi:hypothetical protein
MSRPSRNEREISSTAAMRHNMLLFSPMYTHVLLCSYQSLLAEPSFREREGFGCPFTAHNSVSSSSSTGATALGGFWPAEFSYLVRYYHQDKQPIG